LQDVVAERRAWWRPKEFTAKDAKDAKAGFAHIKTFESRAN